MSDQAGSTPGWDRATPPNYPPPPPNDPPPPANYPPPQPDEREAPIGHAAPPAPPAPPAATAATPEPDSPASHKSRPDAHPLSAKSMLRDAARDSGEIARDVAVDLFYRGAMVAGIILAIVLPIAAIFVGGLLTWRAFSTGSSKVGPIFTIVLAVIFWTSSGSPLGALGYVLGGGRG